MNRLLRFFATAWMIALVVFLMSGCGEDTSSTPAQTITSRGSKAAASSSGGKPEDLVGQVVTPTDLSPEKFKNSIESRRPIVVTFYLSGPYDDSQVRSYVSSLESKYRGQADFYDYLYTDSQNYGDLTTLLKVGTTPTVVIINKQSQVQRAWSGYADSKSIEQGIDEAVKQSP